MGVEVLNKVDNAQVKYGHEERASSSLTGTTDSTSLADEPMSEGAPPRPSGGTEPTAAAVLEEKAETPLAPAPPVSDDDSLPHHNRH